MKKNLVPVLTIAFLFISGCQISSPDYPSAGSDNIETKSIAGEPLEDINPEIIASGDTNFWVWNVAPKISKGTGFGALVLIDKASTLCFSDENNFYGVVFPKGTQFSNNQLIFQGDLTLQLNSVADLTPFRIHELSLGPEKILTQIARDCGGNRTLVLTMKQ